MLEKTRSLRVENLPSSISEDLLKLYFESAKNGNGIVSSLEMTLEHTAAVISFEDSEVLDVILSKEHKISKTPIYVYPYYESIGSALYGNKRPVVKMLDPFLFEIDSYILRFLKQDEKRIAEIMDRMSSCHCNIAFPESGQSNLVNISPALSKHMSSFENLAKNWKKEASDNLVSILSKYKTNINDTNKSVWEIIQNDLRQYLNQNVVVIPDTSKGKVIITGVAESVDILQQTFKSIVNDAIKKLEREKQSISEVVPIPPAKYDLLLNNGLESSFTKQFPNLNMKYSPNACHLILYGLSLDVYCAKSKLLEELFEMKEKQVNLDPCLVEFLRKVHCQEVSSHLFTSNGISAAFDIQGNSVVLTGSEDTLCEAEKQIKRHLTFKCIEIQDISVIRKNEWTDIKGKLDKSLNSQSKRVDIEEKTLDRHAQIIISGYSDAVCKAFEKLSEFVKKNTIIQRSFLDEKRTISGILSSDNVSDNSLRKYFENFITSGGSLTFFSREGRNITVSFESVEDTQAVLRQRVHLVENIQLTVKSFHPKRSNTILQSSAVLLNDLPKDITCELLSLFVEKLTDLEEARGEFSLEIITDIDAAVITFKTDIDLSEFIQKCSNKFLKQQKIGAKMLEKTRSLRVENLPSSISEDLLKLYFESAKNGNGIVSSLEMTLEHTAAVISFEDSEVLDVILSKEHKISKTPIYVYPYYESIGSALYGNKRPVVKMLDPFLFEIDSYILRFLKQDEKRIAEIMDRMSSCHCNIAFPESGQSNLVNISPALSKHMSSFENLAKNWKKEASDNLVSILSKYKTNINDTNKSVWEIIQNDLRQYLNQNVVVIPDTSKGKVIITGVAESVDILQQTFKSIVNDAIKKLEREKQSISEVVPIPPAKYDLLLNNGLESSFTKQFPNLNMKYSPNACHLILYGLSLDVYCAKSKLLEELFEMKEKQVNLDPCLVEFLRKVHCQEVSSHLFTSNGISAAFDIQGNSVVLTGSEDTLCEAEKQIKRHLTFKCIEIQDISVIRKNEWTDIKGKLDKSLNSQSKRVDIEEKTLDRHAQIIISGYSDAVCKAFEKLSEFVKKNTIIQRNIPFKSCGVLHFLMAFEKINVPGVQIEVHNKENHASVSVVGLEENVCQAEDILLNQASKIVSKMFKMNRPGIKQSYKENEEYLVSTAKRKFHCFVRPIEHMEGNGDLSPTSCKVQMPNGPSITVYKGDLCESHVDVVVNSSNEDLKHIGGLAKALSDAAGTVLQKDCDWIIKHRGPLMPGEAVLTESGRLPCSAVIHAVGPRWSDTDPNTAKKRLRSALKESLHLAEAYNFKSIAIPAISSGIFGFPLELCAEIIAMTVREHCANLQGGSTLSEIHLVNNDAQSVHAVSHAVQKIFGDLINSSQQVRIASGNMRNRSIKCLHEAQTKEGLNILVVKGNIQDMKAGVIVNVIGMDLDLSSCAVSKAILEKAGPSLKRLLWEEQKRKQPFMGMVYETQGCNLDCNEVYHAVFPRWEQSRNAEKVFEDIIRDCLKNTEESQQDSIAFPAIGSGKLSFPKDVVAQVMFKTVLKFSSERRSAHLKKVYFVVHPDDRLVVQAMSQEFQKVFTKQQNTAVPIDQPKSMGLFIGNLSETAPGLAEMLVGPILLQVVSGDITKESTDVIVNSSNGNFTLKAGVSKAILDAAGPTVEAECHQKGSQANSATIITSAGKLRCQAIIHMVGQTDPTKIKATVGEVLQLCEQQKFSSVAFPAVGTGQGNAKPSQVADAMIDSVVEFIKKKPSASLRKIRIVIFQPQMLSEFHNRMKMREGSNIPVHESFIKKISSAITSVFWGEQKKENAVSFIEENIEFKDGIETAHFEICGNHEQTIENTISFIKSMVSKDQSEEVIINDFLFKFSENEHEELHRLQKSLQISLELQRNQSGAQIKICGITKDVLMASTKIHRMIEDVRRNEFEKGGTLTDSLPTHWDDMQNLQSKSVELQQNSKEYQDVALSFKVTVVQRQIVKIERLQNPCLWKNYMIKKQQFDNKNPRGTNNERNLFHGTAPDALSLISRHGFNRSYAGRNATMYGNGTYFAVNASYSAHNTYSKPDANGMKYVYRARVLTGIYCRGQGGMVVPPSKSPSDPTDLYDSVADNTATPSMFIIFNDVQAYPEYLITFI
ncbi:protein mono-ADP-ribosyltransferase PARP14-like isoform X2 [Mobula birostris]